MSNDSPKHWENDIGIDREKDRHWGNDIGVLVCFLIIEETILVLIEALWKILLYWNFSCTWKFWNWEICPCTWNRTKRSSFITEVKQMLATDPMVHLRNYRILITLGGLQFWRSGETFWYGLNFENSGGALKERCRFLVFLHYGFWLLSGVLRNITIA